VSVLFWIGLVLVVLWLLGWLALEIAGFLIHLVIIVAVVLLVLGLLRRTTGPQGGP
jgi:hypothetical protein